jgi:hypothetical protein
MYQYIHEDDENTFQLVDSTRLPRPPYQKRPRYQPNVKLINYENNKMICFLISVIDKIKIKIIALVKCKNNLLVHRRNRKQ